MALITGTLAIVANSTNSLTFNTAELAALISDPYWSETLNWKKIVVRYTYLNQHLDVTFNGQTGLGKAKFAARALTGVWSIHSITIVDYMNARLFLSQGQVPSRISYNLSVTGGVSYTPEVGGNITWDKVDPTYLIDLGTDSGLQRGTGTATWNKGAKSTAINGDFVLQYKVTPVSSQPDLMLGYSTSDPDMSLGLSTLGDSSSRTLYFEASTQIQHYGTTWTTNPISSLVIGVQYTFTITRVGDLITYTIVGDALNKSGTIQSGYSGAIYPTISIYSAARLDSVELTQ